MVLIKKIIKSIFPNATIDEAKNGEEAFEKVRSYKYQAILMDLQMPVMDGIVATACIRKYEKQSGLSPVPIIALTAGVLKEEREKAFAVGMDEFLSKPIDQAKLREVLERFVH